MALPLRLSVRVVIGLVLIGLAWGGTYARGEQPLLKAETIREDTGTESGSEVVPSVGLVLELTDGSRIIGTPNISVVLLRVPLGTVEFPLKVISTIEIQDDPQTVCLKLRNGCTLKGVWDLRVFSVTTIFGDVTVPIEHIKKVVTGVEMMGALEKAQKTNVTLQFTNAQLRAVVSYLSEVTRINIVIDDKVLSERKPGKVTCALDDVPLPVALTHILEPHGFGYRIGDNCIFISNAKGTKHFWESNVEAKGKTEALLKEKKAEELLRKLRKTEPRLEFVDGALSAVVSQISILAGINLVLDERALVEEEPLKVTCSLRDIPPLEALHVILWPRAFDYHIQENHIFISNAKGIKEYRAKNAEAVQRVTSYVKEGEMRQLLKKAQQKRLSMDFERHDLREVISWVSEVSDIKIVIGQRALSRGKPVKVTCTLTNVPVLECLGVILWPRGFKYHFEKDHILISAD